MRLKGFRTGLCGLLLCAQGFSAQAVDIGQLWTKARETDPTYLGGVAKSRESRALLDQVKGSVLPQVRASLSASNHHVSQLRGIASTNTESRYGSENQSISLRQAIWHPALLAEINGAMARSQAAQWTLVASEIDLAQRFAAHLFDRFTALDQQQWLRAKIAHAKGMQAAVEMRVQQGLDPQVNVLEAQANVFKLEAQLEEAQALEVESLHALTKMIGEEASLTNPFPISPKAQTLPAIKPLVNWLEKSRMHASIRAQKAILEAAQFNRERQAADHGPTVEAFAQLSKSLSENLATPSSGYLNRQIGISLTVPLYAGGSTRAAVQAAEWNLEAEQQRLNDATQLIEQSTQSEFNAYALANANLKSAYAQWLFAKATAESAAALYQGGFKGGNDLLQSQSAQWEAQKDWRQSLYRAHLALLKLKLMGGDDPKMALSAAFENRP